MPFEHVLQKRAGVILHINWLPDGECREMGNRYSRQFRGGRRETEASVNTIKGGRASARWSPNKFPASDREGSISRRPT